ncbi:uncharacterized protein LOC132754162 [Ruditapes philippinarum]|uniref:uncharacterized protein LOC132754162 n=1 Tax=Ruditapes philippinarum TaxID=129788 RepID=UPI00295AA3A5|nr:uncharacterized protein LOC132754162 [Ruditapes philippinarum]
MALQNGNSGNHKYRCGEPQAEGCLCDNTLTSVEACECGLSCQLDSNAKGNGNKLYICQPDIYTPKDECDAASNMWEMVYSHDNLMNTIDGSLEALTEGLRNGAEVKVWSPFYGLTNIQKSSIHSIINDEPEQEIITVSGQCLFWTQNNRNLANIYLIFAAKFANVHASQFFINDPVNRVRINRNTNSEMKWFIRHSSRNVVGEANIIRAIADGSHVRVSVNDTFRHLEVADISGQVLKGVSMFELRDVQSHTQFNTTEQWLLTNWTTTGVLRASWLVNDHILAETQELPYEPDWLVDPCWMTVYRHADDGTPLFGNIQDLNDAVNAGKRIKCRIGDKIYEANVVRQPLGSSKVIAQIYDSINFDVALGRFEWLNVDTDGNVQTIEYDMGSTGIQSDTNTNAGITWFAEYRNYIDITTESTTDKSARINAGADIRYSVIVNNERTWYQADYAQEKIILGTRALFMYNLYNEREFVVDGSNYIRRYSFVKYDTGRYNFYDYLLGDLNQYGDGAVEPADADVQMFARA